MRVFSTLVASLLILLISGEYSMAISIDTFKEALPAEIDGWKLADDPAAYDKTTLYEYIDGGAELFIAYGFKTLYSFRYTSVEDEEIVIDVFDMGNSYDAYGVFKHRPRIGIQLRAFDFLEGPVLCIDPGISGNRE